MSSGMLAGVRVNPFRAAIEVLMEKAEAWDRDHAVASVPGHALVPVSAPATAAPKPAKQSVAPERIVHRGCIIERTATGWYILKGTWNQITGVVYRARDLVAPAEFTPVQVRRRYDEKNPREPDKPIMSPKTRSRVMRETNREAARKARWARARSEA